MEYKRAPKKRVLKKIVRARVVPSTTLVSSTRLGVPSRPRSFTSLNSVITRPPVINVKHHTKLLFNEDVIVGAVAGASNAYVFSANGLYDPNITGAGHQPMGFDQLMLLYEHYTVLGGKITVSFANQTVAEGGYIGLAIFPDATVETTPTKMVENGLIRRSYIAPNAGNPKSQVTMTMPFTIAKINGVTRSIIGDDLYRGDIASNPTEQTYLHCFVYNPSTANLITVHISVLIEFDAWFTEPRKLAQS